MAHARIREAHIRNLIDTSSLHEVAHALVEVCHGKVHGLRDDQRRADDWREACKALTQLETLAKRLEL